MRGVAMTRSNALFLLLLSYGVIGQPAAGQERLSVVVEYIAGTNIYLGAGTDVGITVNDTLLVYGASNDEKLGLFLVMSSTQERSMVTFAGDPFPVTRGSVLQIAPRSEATTGSRPADTPRGGPTDLPVSRAANRAVKRSPRASGRLSIDVNVLDSTTKPGGDQAVAIDRRFTTPAVRLRMRIAQLPGGLTLNTNFRAASRFASGAGIEPTQSLRIYQASLEKSFQSVPVQMHAGRFYNPFETFSGYWDGLLLHVGGEGLGVGVAAGFQPYLTNEDFRTDVPKYSAFVNYRKSSGAVRYYADLSGHKLQPSEARLDRTYIGLSQRLYWNRFSISQRLQVDRYPLNDRWTVTQLDVRSSIPMGRNLSLLGRYSLRKSSVAAPADDPIPTSRERATVGFAYYFFSGNIGADVTANRWDSSDISLTYASHLNFPRTPLLGLGFRAAASHWKRGNLATLYLSPGIRHSSGRLQSELSYQRYSTEGSSQTVVSEALELFLTFPIARKLFYTLQGRGQWGDVLNSNSLYTGIWLSF
jgi:hypothetical protein